MKLNEIKRQEKPIGENPDIFERFENMRYFYFIIFIIDLLFLDYKNFPI